MSKRMGSLLSHLKKHLSEAKSTIQERGIHAAQKLMKERLERWQDVEVSLAVVGDSGAGKSSFVNSIRRLEGDEPNAAKTGVTETTMVTTEYSYPANPKVKLWDIPGIGTPTFPNLKTYCKKVDIEKYDTFIIMGAGRFTINDTELAKKLVSINKPFLFVRAKIDIDYNNEKKTKRQFNEEEMLRKIRAECSTLLKGLLARESDIFLISNNHQEKWDYPRLTDAILNNLSHHKQEAFCLSMYILSEDILKRKVKTLRGRIWMVALLSIIAKTCTTKSFSRKVDYKFIIGRVKFYRSRLGFPEQVSEEFKGMTEELRQQVDRFYLTDAKDVKSWLTKFDSASGDKDPSPDWLDQTKAIEAPFKFVYRSLNGVLDEMEKIALKILNDATRQEPDEDIESAE